MITCYEVHVKREDSLLLIKQMTDYGYEPNCITLTDILASCSLSIHIGQGQSILYMVLSDLGSEPWVEHDACMVDLFGRLGYT